MSINFGNNTTQDRPAKVLQVVQNVYTGQMAGSGKFSDPGVLDTSITPQFSNSKILVLATLHISTAGTTTGIVLRRNASTLTSFIGNQWGGARPRVTTLSGVQTSWMESNVICALDSPGTTSSITYDFTMGSHDGRTWYVNRSSNDTDNSDWDNATTCSTMTLLEIAA